jgi:signal transduction histidine kinase/DNA-binding response OmpR family regulator
MKNLLDLCINITGMEYGYIYCYVNENYNLITSVHKKENPDHELICTYFNFDKNVILTQKEAKGKIDSKGFIIRELLIVPIFDEKNKKLGLLILGSGLDIEKTPIQLLKKDKISLRKKHISNPSISIEKILIENENVFENLNPVKNLIQTFLEVEKYKYLFEHQMSLGITEFSKDFLLVNMGHEIRTPLNGIIGYIQLLSKTTLNEVQNKYLSSINNCCFQLMQIVNDILDYARLSTNKVDLHEECISVKDLSLVIQDIMGTQLQFKNQSLVFNISSKIPEFIYVDKSKLVQILLNLLSNAQKFSPEYTEIKVKIKLKDDNMLLFEVIDQGIGIAEEDKEKLFYVFTQLRNNIVNVGTGLGLAISKKIVELMGGMIWVKSKMGKGSSFYFSIKFNRCEDIEKRIINNLPLIKGKYVLIIDDNITSRMMISDLIFEWEMVPIPCASGIEAIRLIINKRYDFGLALIDILPEMNSLELAKLIKEEQPYLPLIAMGSADILIQDENFDQRLDKPINKLKLFNSILKLLTSEISREYQLDDRLVCTKIDSPREKNYKILIAETMSYNLTLLVNILNSLEYKYVDTAYDGKTTIKKIDKAYKKNDPYDILILDLIIPQIDGYGVIKHIKGKKYNTQIIVITTSVLQREKCLEAGIDFFISNPIEIKQLKNVICQITSKLQLKK